MHADPQQFTNLASSAKHATLVDHFREQLRDKLAALRANDLTRE
jgi:hypothetical protein